MGEIVPPFIYGLYTAGVETAEIHDAVVVGDGDIILNKTSITTAVRVIFRSSVWSPTSRCTPSGDR